MVKRRNDNKKDNVDKMHGVPMFLWNEECFSKLVAVVGTLIEIGEVLSFKINPHINYPILYVSI